MAEPLEDLGALLNRIEKGEWVKQASCRDIDTSYFFPSGGNEGIQRTKDVQQICSSCPVRAECLTDALRAAVRHGLWGGISAKKRRNLGAQFRKQVYAEGYGSYVTTLGTVRDDLTDEPEVED